MIETVGIVGLGTMGKAIASRLAQQGFQVYAWNRTPLATNELGVVHIVEDIATIGTRADVILLCIADYQAAQNILMRLHPPSSRRPLVLQLGTVSPEQVIRLYEEVAASVSAFLDVGMLGNRQHALDGELRLYIGGEKDAVAQVQPFLAAISKEATHVGVLGKGMAMKLTLNVLMGIEMEALAEAVTFGEQYGIERHMLIEALSTSGFSSPVMTFKSRRLLTQQYDAPDFRLALMHKDLQLFVESSQKEGLVVPAAQQSLQVLQEAMEIGLGEKDCTAVALAVHSLMK